MSNSASISSEPTPTASTSNLLSNQTYDVLKWIVQLALPALGTLYFTLASIWSLPYGEQVVGTITAVALCGGVLLGLSNKTYTADGVVMVDRSDPEKDLFTLIANGDPADWANQKSVTLNVHNNE